MPDWSSGYVADIGYTYGAYAEFNPQRVRFALLLAGLVPPAIDTACELGFGQGLGINLHAAASSTCWHGTDFNPSQAAFAQELRSASLADVHLQEQAFSEFCARADLPDFDFIGLHGIFSWISDDNRHVIVDFARRKLKPGGVLYLSYNTQPGWAPMVPVRELLSEHAATMAPPGSSAVDRIAGSLAFMDRMVAAGAGFLVANPELASRFAKVRSQDPAYLAHEYFNRDWQPFQFSRMARWLEPAKLDFACSAHLPDHVDDINLTVEQRRLLAEVDDPVFAQTVRDYLVNGSFRRDYWIKGPRRLDPAERQERLLQERLMLAVLRDAVPLKATASLGEVTLQPQVYAPLLDQLEQAPCTVGELLGPAAKKHGTTFDQLLQMVTILVGTGSVAVMQADDAATAARASAQRLNRHLCGLAAFNPALHHLAAPAIGGALALNRFDLLFLASRAQGGNGPEEWAAAVASLLERQGKRLAVEGKPLDSREQQLEELVREAVRFRDRTLPLLQRAGAID
jgi:hypothetical protein